MCKNESHEALSRTEHLFRHTMSVEIACAALRHGSDKVSLEDTIQEAQDALDYIDSGVSEECIRMLRLAVKGDLRAAAQL